MEPSTGTGRSVTVGSQSSHTFNKVAIAIEVSQPRPEVDHSVVLRPTPIRRGQISPECDA